MTKGKMRQNNTTARRGHVRSILYISSGHLDRESNVWLDDPHLDLSASFTYGERFVLAWPELPPGELPACLDHIRRQARSEGCDYVLISDDADPHPTLPVYEP